MLKQQFDGFAPQQPADVWQHVRQHNIANHAAASSKIVVAIKSASIVSKIAVTLSAAIVVVASALLIKSVTQKNNTPTDIKESKTILYSKPVNKDKTTPPATENKIVTNKKSVYKNTNTVRVKVSTSNQQKNIATISNTVNTISTNPTYNNSNAEASNLSVDNNKQKQQILSTKLSDVLTDKPNKIADENPETPSIKPQAEIKSVQPDIPNTFTPGDDDNFNKEFIIKIENEILYRLKVMDSKGNIVFESNNKENHWNGQHYKTGENMESAVYFYIFDYQYKNETDTRNLKGKIYLTR